MYASKCKVELHWLLPLLLQIGRKPLGPHKDECDKTYRRTGLRGRYYSGNLA